MTQIIIAPHKETIQHTPIFLAGPVHNAPQWQDEAIALLKDDAVTLLSPRGYETDDSIFVQEEQIAWEIDYLDYVRKHGVVLFWFPRSVYDSPDDQYAQTSLFELGMMLATDREPEKHIALGIEEGFSPEAYLEKRIIKTYPSITMTHTLKESCLHAKTLVKKL